MFDFQSFYANIELEIRVKKPPRQTLEFLLPLFGDKDKYARNSIIVFVIINRKYC